MLLIAGATRRAPAAPDGGGLGGVIGSGPFLFLAPETAVVRANLR